VPEAAIGTPGAPFWTQIEAAAGVGFADVIGSVGCARSGLKM
jgi:hypothetical protein